MFKIFIQSLADCLEEENDIKIVLDHFGIRCINATIKTEYDTSL